jgi:hypothetical protein
MPKSSTLLFDVKKSVLEKRRLDESAWPPDADDESKATQ